jgi:hypothetical protein
MMQDVHVKLQAKTAAAEEEDSFHQDTETNLRKKPL